MKAFHAVAAATNLESEWAIQPYREALWCAAFQVESLDGYFDLAPAESAIRVLTYAIERFNTHTEDLRPHHSAEDFLDLRGNQRVLMGIRKFLLRSGGTISGAMPRDEIQPE